MSDRLQGTSQEARLPLLLAVVILPIFVVTFIATPEGQLNWLLEVGPGLVGMIALAVCFKRFPMSRFIYICVFLHILILVYGGYYSYAKAPLGEWMKVWFGFSRNNYDKIGHFAFGFFPVFVLAEVLLRVTPLKRGGWLNFILIWVILGFGAGYELFEWGAAVTLDPGGGDKFLGTQGDVWDAQSDMLFAGIGAVVGMLTLSRVHARSMERLFSRLGAASPAG